jgi:putative nucleotidyltransferase with HDIG domain
LTDAEVEQAVSECPAVEFFRADGPPGLQSLAIHSATTRTAADMVARAIDFPGREELRVAALLHDAGKLVLEVAWDGFATIDDVRRTPPGRRIERERRLIGIDHAMVSALATRRWALPDRIAVVVEAHHSSEARGPAAMIRLADMLAHYAHGNAVSPRELVEAARIVEMDRATLGRLMYEISRAPHLSGEARSRSPLAPMQTRVLAELATGKRYREIAAALGISESTVRSHAHMTYRKLGVKDRAQAVLLATKRGWL